MLLPSCSKHTKHQLLIHKQSLSNCQNVTDNQKLLSCLCLTESIDFFFLGVVYFYGVYPICIYQNSQLHKDTV